MKNAVAVGFSCVDVYENLNQWYPTGNGIDWGIHLVRLGIPVSVISAVGTDVYGKKMCEQLQKEKIDISHLAVREGQTCQMHMALKDGIDRVHLDEISGVMENYQITEEEFEYASQFNYLHTDLFGGVLEHLPEWKKRGVKIVMDFSEFTRDPEFHCMDIFPYVDYVFFSHPGEENEQLCEWMKTIGQCGPKIVIATMGEKGSISWDGNTFYRCGIEKAHVVNTVGAGDSYIAGFTWGLINGQNILDCMKKGAEVSAQTVGKFEPY